MAAVERLLLNKDLPLRHQITRFKMAYSHPEPAACSFGGGCLFGSFPLRMS